MVSRFLALPKKTPTPFITACSQFIFTENLIETEDSINENKAEVNNSGSRKLSRNELRKDSGLVKLLRTAVKQTAEDDGWSHLGQVGQYISNNSPFSPVNYGYKKLSDIARVSDLFKVEIRKNNSVMYVKDERK